MTTRSTETELGSSALAFAIAVCLSAGCHADGEPRGAIADGKASAAVSARAAGSGEARPGAAADSIGVATMDPDGTILLQLRAEGPDGVLGDALIRYPPSHKDYKDVLTHLGGLKPGQSKPVPPWP